MHSWRHFTFIWRGLGILLCGLLLCAQAHAGEAAPPTVAPNASCPKTNADSKAAGDAAMLSKDYAVALSCYEAAYAYSPTPALLYNRARALQMFGRAAEALKLLRLFQRAASPELQARVSGLEGLISSLESQVATLQVDCNVEGAEVRIDGAVVGKTPLTDVPVDAGTVSVQVNAAGYAPLSRTLTASAGAKLVMLAELSPEGDSAGSAESMVPVEETRASPEAVGPASPAPASPAPASPAPVSPVPVVNVGASPEPQPADTAPQDVNWPMWTALGVGAVSAGVAVLSFVQATHAANQVCGGQRSCTESEHDASAYDSYKTWKEVYAGSAIVAGVGLAVGGFLWWRSQDDNTRVGLSPTGVRVQGRF